MAAADDKKGMTCNCGCGRMGGGHWTIFLLRTLLTILILMIIFWFGVQVGRMTGGASAREDFMMRSGYGARAMPMMQMTGSSTMGSASGY